jgi:CRP/FNR family transcriptional regulator, cyclic AMP receptor protein
MADKRSEMLKKVPLFSACNDKQIAFIGSQVEEMDFPAGKTLCRQGESGGEFFVLLSGTCDVQVDGRSIRSLSGGDFFGEIALIDHGPRTATVVTKEPIRALVLSRSQFQNVLHQNEEITMAVMAALGARLRTTLGMQSI